MPNVDEILKGAQDTLTVTRVYGEPIEADGVTVVPAAAVRGGGGGGGDADGDGGGGFGVMAKPVGAYVIRGNQVSWVPAVDVTRVLLIGLAALLVLRSIVGRR
jgi:uncharacterized spore protein YtfJ